MYSLKDSIPYGTDSIPTSLLLVLAGTWIIYKFIRSAYNLFFHPLSHIPGPKLSAASYFPEFYYDVVRSGLYTKQIMQMHEQYGTIFFTILPNSHSHTDKCTQARLSALVPTKFTAAIVISSMRFMLREAENGTNLYIRSGAVECKQPLKFFRARNYVCSKSIKFG